MTDAPNGDLDGQCTPPNIIPDPIQNCIEEDICEIIVLAKNARINTSDRIVQVLGELEGHPWDVILFSETRATKNKIILDGGHALYTNLTDNVSAGVGILLHAKHVKGNNSIHNVSGRVIALDFILHGKRLRCISIYVPHCGYSAPDLAITYEQLRCCVSEAHRLNRSVVIGGDFNTQVNVGIRGTLLEYFSQEFNLCITNGSIPETIDDWTFRSTMGVKRRFGNTFFQNSVDALVTYYSPGAKLMDDITPQGKARSDQAQSSVHKWTRHYNNLIIYWVPVGLHQGPSPRT